MPRRRRLAQVPAEVSKATSHADDLQSVHVHAESVRYVARKTAWLCAGPTGSRVILPLNPGGGWFTPAAHMSGTGTTHAIPWLHAVESRGMACWAAQV